MKNLLLWRRLKAMTSLLGSDQGSDKELLHPGRSSPDGSEGRINVNGDLHSYDRTPQPGMTGSHHHRASPDHGLTGNTIECPTCQGKGKLSQGQADGMVALIPVKDSRLKPRRTKFYIFLTLAFCVLTFGLLAVFLMPRSVSLTINSVDSYNISITPNKTQVPYIDMMMVYSIKNENFFSVDLSNLEFQILWNKGQLVLNYTSLDYSIGSRTTKQSKLLVRTYFSGTQAGNIRKVCLDGWQWKITEKFSASAKIVYLGRSEQISTSLFQFIDCYGLVLSSSSSSSGKPNWTK